MATNKPFFAARLEDRWHVFVERVVRNRGWSERVVDYISYGSPEFVRIMCRVVLAPPDYDLTDDEAGLLRRRGWRNFMTVPVESAPVEVRIGGVTWEGRTSRGGFVDARLDQRGLSPGWHNAEVWSVDSPVVDVPVMVVDPAADYGVVSDIDDTVISTSLPRPLLAAWNTFVLHETARQAVPQMSSWYRELVATHPGSPIFYLSTGAWNVAPTLVRFLKHHRFPLGPLLLTDWGPTNTGWFRSGREHKERMLRRLAVEFPQISWVLIGDDGQHDPTIYGEFAAENPARVRAIAIRQLTPGEQVLAHGSPARLSEAPAGLETPEVRGADGAALGRALAGLEAGDQDLQVAGGRSRR